jgi:hypothetical protein
MKDDKAKRATSVKSAPRMTAAETPAASAVPMAAVPAAAPKRGKGSVRKAAPNTAAKRPAKTARKAARPRAAAKEATRPAVAKAAVTSAPKPAVAKAPAPANAAARPKAPAAPAPASVPAAAQVKPSGLPAAFAEAASTALQSALRGGIRTGGVFPMPQAALAPLSAALESGAEQARSALGRARASGDNLQQAVAQSATATARAMLEVNDKILDGLRAQNEAALDLWRSAVTAGSLSELVRVQTSGIRMAYELSSTQAKDLAATATRAVGDAVKPLQAALPTPRS